MAQGEIREKLDGFIRKYYLNQLVKGILMGSTLVLAVFLFLNLSEYYGHFSTAVRGILFWSFWLVLGFVVWQWILKPLLGLYRLGRVITYKDAALIIGEHFTEVKDKLTNLLQLEEMHLSHPESGLVLAGIEQKTRELKPVQFSKAINLQANKKYLRYLALPVVLTGVILVFQSNIITEGAGRLMNYNKHYAKKAPFAFVLLNKSLDLEKGSDLKLELSLEGKAIPDEVYLNYMGQEIKMVPDENGNFTYQLKNLGHSASFHFAAAGFTSGEYQIKVSPVPMLTGSYALVNYPAYTGKASEKLPGTSDFVVPEGTEIQWVFDTKDAEKLTLISDGNKENIAPNNKRGRYEVVKKFFKSQRYHILPGNTNAMHSDTVSFSVSVIPDQLPTIFTEQKDDTADIHQFYFLGNAADDYGVSRITFNYRFIQSEEAGKMSMPVRSVPMNAEIRGGDASFYYVLNMNALGMSPSDEIEYYFEVWDNDGIHGSKSTRTRPVTLRRKSVEESRKEADVTAGNVQNMMQDAYKDAKELQKQSRQLIEQMNKQRNTGWENKSRIDELLNKQQEMFEKISEIQQEKEKLRQQKEEFQKNEEFTERQKQLDELFKQMEDPELKKLMEEIQKLLEKQASKEQLKEKVDQLENKNRDWARDMEKLMEQYKQLQLEQKLTDNIERLEKLADKEEKLAEKAKTADPKALDKIEQEQKEIKAEFQDIQKEIEEAEKMNQELEKPMNLDMGKEESQAAESEMGEAEKNLENDKSKKASENQKKAAEEMRKAAQKIKESLEDEKSKQMEEDYQKIRELLENLVDASIEQEQVFTELGSIREYNPRFVELNRKQMKIREECAMIEDSLRALAKRQPMISTFITRELSRINQNMEYALGHLKTRSLGEAAMREQYVMTGLNNVAVMLMESLDQMQQKLSEQKKKKQGSQSCNNPNGSGEGQKNKGKKMSEGQQQLGKSLQALQQKAQQQRQSQNGKDGKDGKDGKEGQRELNKEYAKAALIQEALRRQLQEMRRELEKEGPEGKALSKELQKTEEMMEQQERDLVNKKITEDMIKRQKEIETRMLEHEKSDRNQQQEEKRESNQPGDYKPELPAELRQYLKEKSREREMLRKSPPELTPYYREKSREYLRSVK